MCADSIEARLNAVVSRHSTGRAGAGSQFAVEAFLRRPLGATAAIRRKGGKTTTLFRTFSLAFGAVLLALVGCGRPADRSPDKEAAIAGAAREAADPVAVAASAGPAALSVAAAVATIGKDGTVRQLRKGGNNFTCIPDNVKTSGIDPMCMDGNGMKWLVSWMTGSPPPAGPPGLIYMLSIGRAGSATGPRQLPASCLRIGPHLMMVGARSMLTGYPSASPGGKAPFVMSAGTPYAHLIVPVG